MFFAIFYLGLIFLVGLFLTSGFKLSDFEKILGSYLLGTIVASWLAFLPALFFESMKTGIFFSLLLLIILLYFFRQKISFRFKIGKFEMILFVFLLIFSIFINIKSVLTKKADGIYAGPNNWGDVAYHLSLVNSFANSDNFPPQEPIYAGHRLRYYFMVDFFSAILKFLNLEMRWSILLPNILNVVVFFSLVYCFGIKITKKKFVAVLSIIFLIFSGGLGFVSFFKENARNNIIWALLNNHQRDYTNAPELGYQFGNLTTTLLPRRALPFGLAFSLFTLCVILPFLFEEKEIKKKELVILGSLAGLSFLFHAYSLFCTTILIFTIALFYRKKEMIYYFVPLGIFAIFQLPFFFPKASFLKNFLSLKLGWVAPKSLVGFIIFWIKNLGLFLPLFLMAFFVSSKKNKILYSFSNLFFLLPNIIQFQPYDYDNILIFFFWLIFVAIACAESVYFIFQKGNFGKSLFLFLFIFTILSGFIAMVWFLNTSWKLYTEDDLKIAEWIVKNTEKSSIFLTAENHNHLVPMLAGRTVYRGYGGWLWTRGIDWQERIPFVRSAYQGEISKEELLKEKISFVFVGPMELYSEDYRVNLEFFEKNFKKVFDNSKIKIYKVF